MNHPQRKKLVIAIDGPAGAGKSTIAAHLARKLGYVNLESGAMYRALALKAIENDIFVGDGDVLLDLAKRSYIALEPMRDGNRVLLDRRDVSRRIREADVTQAASRISTHPQVREWMVARQREMGLQGGVIMEGRDIGTVVFPHADVKIFLDADQLVRAGRRIVQQRATDDPKLAEKLTSELQERDRRDSTRDASPLTPASDAIHIDSTNLSLAEVIAEAERVIDEKVQQQQAAK